MHETSRTHQIACWWFAVLCVCFKAEVTDRGRRERKQKVRRCSRKNQRESEAGTEGKRRQSLAISMENRNAQNRRWGCVEFLEGLRCIASYSLDSDRMFYCETKSPTHAARQGRRREEARAGFSAQLHGALMLAALASNIVDGARRRQAVQRKPAACGPGHQPRSQPGKARQDGESVSLMLRTVATPLNGSRLNYC